MPPVWEFRETLDVPLSVDRLRAVLADASTLERFLRAEAHTWALETREDAVEFHWTVSPARGVLERGCIRLAARPEGVRLLALTRVEGWGAMLSRSRRAGALDRLAALLPAEETAS